jgi:hypothetical protein
MSTSTIGRSIGAAIGKGAAYTAHGAIRAAQGTGRFGQDVLAGTTEGYTSKAAELATRRLALAAQRQAPVAITVTSSRKRVAA